jgi:hypothetical protein
MTPFYFHALVSHSASNGDAMTYAIYSYAIYSAMSFIYLFFREESFSRTIDLVSTLKHHVLHGRKKLVDVSSDRPNPANPAGTCQGFGTIRFFSGDLFKIFRLQDAETRTPLFKMQGWRSTE